MGRNNILQQAMVSKKNSVFWVAESSILKNSGGVCRSGEVVAVVIDVQVLGGEEGRVLKVLMGYCRDVTLNQESVRNYFK